MAEMAGLSEDEVFELLAYLVSAARLLVDEPADYGPMRLLSGAQRLCALASPRMGVESRTLLQRLGEEIPGGLRRRLQDPEGYVAFLDDTCTTVARALARRAGREV